MVNKLNADKTYNYITSYLNKNEASTESNPKKGTLIEPALPSLTVVTDREADSEVEYSQVFEDVIEVTKLYKVGWVTEVPVA